MLFLKIVYVSLVHAPLAHTCYMSTPPNAHVTGNVHMYFDWLFPTLESINRRILVETFLSKYFLRGVLSEVIVQSETLLLYFFFFNFTFNHMGAHTSIKSPLFILHLIACRHFNLGVWTYYASPFCEFWGTQLVNGEGMSSFYLRQHEEWLCCRRLGEESVMRKHRFFCSRGGPLCSALASQPIKHDVI